MNYPKFTKTIIIVYILLRSLLDIMVNLIFHLFAIAVSIYCIIFRLYKFVFHDTYTFHKTATDCVNST